MDSMHSWIVAAASCMVMLLASLPIRVGSQLFVSMLDHFGSNRKDTSFPFSLASLMRSLSGPLAGFVGEKFGLQTVTVAGCFLCTIGIGGCYFAENLITYDIFFGIIYGTGFGWSTSCVPEILNQHFDKHKGKANGIFFGGGGLGAFLAPPLIETILYTYGLPGTILILCGIILNIIPAAMLLSKPKSHIRENNKKFPLVQEHKAENTISSPTGSIKNSEITLQTHTYGKNILDSFYRAEKPLISPCLVTVFDSTKNETYSIPLKQTYYNNASHEITEPYPVEDTKTYPVEDTKTYHSSTCHMSPKSAHSTEINEVETNSVSKKQLSEVDQLRDNKLHFEFTPDCISKDAIKRVKNDNTYINFFCKILSPFMTLGNPIFLLTTFTIGVHSFLNYLFWTILVDIVREKNITQDLEVHFVLGMALFDTIGRFFLSSIVDCGFISVSYFSALLMGVMGLLCMFLTWVSGFVPVMILICFLGLVFGGNSSLQPVIITDLIQKEERPMAIASRLLLYVPMSFAMSPLIGYFKGGLGSYDGLMYCMAVSCLICDIILILLPRLSRNHYKMDSLIK